MILATAGPAPLHHDQLGKRVTAAQNEPSASTPTQRLVLIQVLSFVVGDQLHRLVSYGRSFGRTPLLFGPEPQHTVDVNVNVNINRQTDRPTDRRTNGRTDGWTNGWTNGPTDGPTKHATKIVSEY